MREAAILFAVAALGGLTMAIMRLRGRLLPPTWLALLHGAVAAVALGLLIYNALTFDISGLAQAALVVFLLAATGGAVLFLGFHMRNKPLPIPFVLGHGLIAVTGFVLLLIAYFQS